MALLYLKLQSKHLLPASVIQIIAEEFKNIHSLSVSYSLGKMRNLLREQNINDERIEEIIKCLQCSDLFLESHSGQLRSDYSRNQYFKKHFRHVQPRSIVLGKNKQNKECTFQYIPIKETLTSLLQDDSVWSEFKMTGNKITNSAGTETGGNCFCDITDGSAFKKNNFF